VDLVWFRAEARLQPSRNRTSAARSPLTSTTFDRDLAPLTIATALFATPSAFANTFTTALFAAFSTGGAFTRTRNAPPCIPSTPARLDLGCTRTAKRTDGTARPTSVSSSASYSLTVC
jgi:hypothetical protein